MVTERNLLSSSCLAATPAMSFDTSSTIDQRSESTMRCEQLPMGDHVGTDGQCLVTSAGVPNGDFSGRDFQTREEQYRRWHTDFSSAESAKSVRPTSQNSFHWKLQKIDRPSTKNTFTVEELSSDSGSAPTPDLVHPIPRHSPYAVTSYFTSEKIPETSVFGKKESPLSEDKCLLRGSDWTNDDFAFSCLLQERQSPDTSSLTTLPDNYTPVTTDGTYTDHSVSPWPSVKTQLSWPTQTANATQCKEIAWNEPRFFPDVEQQQTHFDQFPVTADNIHGLPSLGHSAETYVQPSSLLDPYGSTCPGLYLNGNTITQQEQSPVPYSSCTFVYQNSLRPDESTDSFYPSGPISYQPSHVGHMATWTNDVKNALLIEYKRQGLSYKDIKRIAGFKEAESTLRGRFRTLTKSKEQRVRKPQWHEKDVSLRQYLDDWDIANSMKVRLHFGNSTCKKKWCEVQGL
jgi:hypothetical protein